MRRGWQFLESELEADYKLKGWKGVGGRNQAKMDFVRPEAGTLCL